MHFADYNDSNDDNDNDNNDDNDNDNNDNNDNHDDNHNNDDNDNDNTDTAVRMTTIPVFAKNTVFLLLFVVGKTNGRTTVNSNNNTVCFANTGIVVTY